MGSIGLVVNPAAKYHRTNPDVRERLGQVLGRADPGFAFAESRSVRDLRRIAADFKAAGVEVLAISGGDGTGAVTISEFKRVYGDQPLPKVAFIRGGTMNTVSNSLGVRRGRPEQLLAGVVAQHRRRRYRTTSVDTMLINEDEHGFLFGIGTLYAFLDAYYTEGQPVPTPLTAAKVLGRGAVSAIAGGDYARRITAMVEADVTIDGERWPRRPYFTVAAGTIEQIGLGFKPFHRIEPGHPTGRFHVLGMHCNPFQFAISLPLVHRKKPMPAKWVTERLAAELKIEAAGGTTSYIVDGELRQRQGAVTVRSGLRLEVVLP